MPDAAENVFAKNSKIHASVACTVIEGLLDGCNFVLVYLVIEEVFAGDFDLGSVLLVSGALAAVFAVRLAVYGWGSDAAYLRGYAARILRARRNRS